MDLVEFLRARLDEDERAAREAQGGFWVVWTPGSPASVMTDFGEVLVGQIERRDDAVHMARHDPARVLVEVAAKRRMVDLLKQAPYRKFPEAWEMDTADKALRLMAMTYADHPDYDKAWHA